ncbi:hypothetical protein [Arthrobacter sp. Bz4]|uniref:hypothetical protein n=1 Tax=Arthrobacter sp. Bz4 TaxID=2171979 RepID=UPI000D5152A5|nr:hypothetical protein [Arthrobacter sp. Bz4]PVE17384.1 hypothetical protein DDA93_10300 [Arthrobacter sp. Bz4]
MKVTKILAIVAVSSSTMFVGASTAMAATDDIVFVPFDQATVVDPDTVTFVTGGVIAADGTNLCAVNPGSIVFPDGTYPCFIDFRSPDPDPAPQVGQMPVGGVDTGVATPAGRLAAATPAAAGIAAAGGLAAAIVLLRQRAVRS